MKSSLQKILKSVRTGINSAFIVILVISLGLWFINELGHVYTTNVVIPVQVVNSVNSSTGVMGGMYDIECMVEGKGFRLLKYKWSSKNDEELIDVARLDLQPVAGSVKSVITNTSMLNALASQMKDVRVLSVSTPRMEIITAEIKSKTVPVISRINVDLNRRYQQVGYMEIIPDSVEVRSLSVLLDTLQGIYTESKSFNNVRGSLSGNIRLVPVEDVMMQLQAVSYSVKVEEFTEVERILTIEVLNAPADMAPIVMPSEAKLKLNVSMSSFSDGSLDNIRAYIDYADSATNIDKYFKVYVDTGSGIRVYDVDPVYTELIFEKTR